VSPLEAAQAEVARLELEARTIPFTTGDKEFIQTTKAAIEQLWKLLGHTRNANAGIGNGRYSLKTIDALQSRLDALEAAASKMISVTIPKVVETWGDTPISNAAPAPKVVARQSSETIPSDDEHNGAALRALLGVRFDIIDHAFGFGDDFSVKASPQRMEALKTVRDRLKTMAEKINDQASAIEKLKVEKNGIYTKTKARKLQLAEQVSDLNRRLANTHQACDGLGEAYARCQNEIATLNTEVATRDRLLDDQAATIGKLEFERDEAKAMLHLVQSRVVGLDLSNPDKMRGQQWVKATRKKQQRVVCDFYGDPVTVPMSMPEMGIQELRSRIERGYSK
jgi:hypothetical protein